MSWIDENVVDWTTSGAGPTRPKRKKTKSIVLHRINLGISVKAFLEPTDDEKIADLIVRFWLEHPGGVATTTLTGSYSSKLPTIRTWKKSGIPKVYKDKAFVPYTFLVDKDGTVYQTLPLDAQGAHAVAHNREGLGVAFIGDFRQESELANWEIREGLGSDVPSTNQIGSGGNLLRDLLVAFPGAEVLTHDQTLERRRKDPKGCPGSLAEGGFEQMARWATLAAGHVLDGDSRR